VGPARGKRFFASDRGKWPVYLPRPFFDLTAWWRYFSGQSIKIAFSAIKMAPPGGDIKFVFGRSNSKFPTLSHAKKICAYLYPKKSCKIFR